MKPKKYLTWLIIFSLLALIVWKLSLTTKAALTSAKDNRLAMDTLITVTLVAPEDKIRSTFEAGFAEIERISNLTDRFNQSSELAKLNAKRSLTISKELVNLIALGENYRKSSQGAFDLRLGRLSDLWGFGTSLQQVPDKDKIMAALPSGEVDILGTKVSLPDNVLLDLGALAKGYAIERAREIMKKTAPAGLILGGGSSVAAWGMHPEKRPWRIGIRHPRSSTKYLGVIELEDGWSLGSSGDYERYFVKDNKRYHHILNSQTGYPKEDVYACSILIKDATLSDILSTLLFVLGPEQGKTFLEEAKLGPLAAFWVIAPGKIVTYEKGVKLPPLTY